MKNKRKAKRKDPNVYPPGWDRQRVQSIISYYDNRKNKDVLNEVETKKVASDLVWVEVPQELVPRVQKLLTRYRRSA